MHRHHPYFCHLSERSVIPCPDTRTRVFKYVPSCLGFAAVLSSFTAQHSFRFEVLLSDSHLGLQVCTTTTVSIFLKITFYLFVCVLLPPTCMCIRGQLSLEDGWFSLSTMWVLGIQLIKELYPLNSLTGSHFSFSSSFLSDE